MDYVIIPRNRCTLAGGWRLDRINNTIVMNHVSDDIDTKPIVLHVYDTEEIAMTEFEKIADEFDSKYAHLKEKIK